jgi:hypothetical protein
MVEYDAKAIPLHEIFNTYGTIGRPKENPKDDPEAPEKIEPPVIQPKTIPEEGGEGAEGAEA